MTLPRRIRAGETSFVTRRCSQRQLLLLPSPEVNDLLIYCVAYVAKRVGMRIHAVTFLGNHYHIVLTDSYGMLPLFQADLNRMIAKALNCYHGRWENFWAPGSYDRQLCVSAKDSLDCMVYTMANGSSSGLVEKADQWPGICTRPEDLDGRVLRVKRPGFFFDPKGKMPDEVELVLEPPPGCEDWDREELIRYLRGRIEEREAEAHEKYNGRFLGVQRILSMRPTDIPKTREPRRNTAKRIAARDKWQRIEAIHELKEFEGEHAECQRRWRAGELDVVFPAGTWWMKHFTPARVQKPPDPSLMN